MGRVSAPDPLSRRQRLVSALCHHFDVEHHALVFMVQDMAVEDEPADVARVGGADKNTVTALDKNRIANLSGHSAILLIGRRRRIAARQVRKRIAVAVDNFEDLKWIDMNVEDVIGGLGRQFPILDRVDNGPEVYPERVVDDVVRLKTRKVGKVRIEGDVETNRIRLGTNRRYIPEVGMRHKSRQVPCRQCVSGFPQIRVRRLQRRNDVVYL